MTKPLKEARQPTSFWLDAETQAILDGLTDDLGLSRSAVVRNAIRLMKSDPQMDTVRKLVAELGKVVAAT